MQDKQTITQDQTTILISFIVTYYNEPDYMLRECIDSIRRIDLASSDREIIIVNDGSNIQPEKIVDNTNNDLRIIHKENGGLSDARNCGLEAAYGEYIQFVDADDMIFPLKYNKCVEMLNSTDIDMLLFGFNRFSENEKISSKEEKTKILFFEGPEYMLHHNIKAAAWCYLFKKSLAKELRFPINMLHEDEFFTPLLLLKVNHLCTISVKAYLYRIRKHSIINCRDEQHIIKRMNDTISIIKQLNEICNSIDGIRKEALRRRVCQLTMDFIYNSINITNSLKTVYNLVDKIKNMKLYPLDVKFYTMKYFIFSIISKNKIGLKTIFYLIKRK